MGIFKIFKRAFVCSVKYVTNVTDDQRYYYHRHETTKLGNRKKKCIFVLIMLLFLICVNKYLQPVRFIFLHQNIHSPCLLPEINPFDKSVMKYIWHPKPIECDPTPSLVFIDSKGVLKMNSSIRYKFNHTSLECFYRIVKRSGDNDVTFLPQVKLEHPVYIPADSVNVRCYSKETLMYDSVLFNVDFKNIMKNKKIEKVSDDDEMLNVLIFGMDSVSRLAAERKLTKTMHFIKNTLNGYVFKGYTSIGGNTYPNVLGTLTGKFAFSAELPNDPRTEFTDSYPFIWKNFSEKGYVTMFSEDFPEISMFNYLLKGFKDSPVDHYLRPYYIARKAVHPVQSNLDQVFMFLEDKSIKLGKYSSLCYRNQPKHVIHIDHFKKYVSTYKNYRTFAFSWLTEIGHDYMNFLELADEDILNMIKLFHEEGILQNSVFIFMSDHGPRTDEIRNTAVGRIEERMPLLSIVLPEHIRRKYPTLEENLKENENRLSSPFDLYETYQDILNQNYKTFDDISKRPYPRGISLFRKIPKDRSCSDGSIKEHYCACYTAKNVSCDNSQIDSISKFVVQSINEKLSQFKQCSTLSLLRTKEAQQIETGLANKEEYNRKTLLNLFYKPEVDNEQRYLVLIETLPGHGLFEATVSYIDDKTMTVLGDVSRTNRYKNQSHCVSYKQLKHICYCKD